MQHDRLITISAAGNRRAKMWQPQQLWWSELVARLATPLRGKETFSAYLAMSKAAQDDRKDVGGFVGGELTGGIRKNAAVKGRDIIALDLDHGPAGGADEVLRRCAGLSCGWCAYSTRKHEPGKPRLRVLIPLDRTVTADEYEPIARKLAELIEIGWCDATTFEPVRMMYWPSVCSDGVYVYRYEDKPFASADGILRLYKDWRDMASWPQVPGQKAQHTPAAKQEDPTTKPGVVGAWCRTYNIYQVMEQFLQGAYEPVDTGEDRYTFTGGSTAGGAIVYDGGKYLFSHHATDPAGGRLVNSFDLVRLHLYGALDDDAKEGTPVARLPSYERMKQMALKDAAVVLLLDAERQASAQDDFSAGPANPDEENWKQLWTRDSEGFPKKEVGNVMVVLENDPAVRGKLAFDEFANRGLALGALPWDSREERRAWDNPDDDGMLYYLEHVHKLKLAERKVFTVMNVYAHRHRFNDVKDYLESLDWDGKPRLDTLLIDYLGAEDNVYTRAVARKSLAAAAARALCPGVKYDYMPILVGPQGIGKSTLLRLLGGRWYSDSLQTFEGKDASEMIQGVWVNEIGELNGFSRAEVGAIKQFLSRTEDIFREAYGRRTGVYPRRCVFFGTTNDAEFLRDRTGNRRFWPVNVGGERPTKSVFNDLAGEVDQIWAEAVMRWRLGEALYLTGEAEQLAQEQQEEHRESDAREGMIRKYLDTPIPEDWNLRSLGDRKLYFSGAFQAAGDKAPALVPRTRVCAAEVWCECFQQDKARIDKRVTRDINGILDGFSDWKKLDRRDCGPYGSQRCYESTVTFSSNILEECYSRSEKVSNNSNIQN